MPLQHVSTLPLMYCGKMVFSSIDHQGRYAYGNQPSIGGWNLSRFAETLLPLIHPEPEQAVKLAQEALNTYSEKFQHHWLQGMRKKLGIIHAGDELIKNGAGPSVTTSTSSMDTPDQTLVNSLLNLMQQHKLDFTNTFLALIRGLEDHLNIPESQQKNPGDNLQGETVFDQLNHPALQAWMVQWRERLEAQPQSLETSLDLMRRSNPAVIPRNHLVEAALKAAEEEQDLSKFHRLMTVLADPYDHARKETSFMAPPKPGKPYRTYCGT